MEQIQQSDLNSPVEEAYIMDTETAGFSGGVCEFAYLKVDANLNILSEFCSLVNPERPIEDTATIIHGITNEQVADKPVLKTFQSHFNEPITMIAHNASFDKRMLQNDIAIRRTYCTLKLVRSEIKHTTDHKLQTLQKELGLPEQKSHSALGDVHTVRDVLLWLQQNTDYNFAKVLSRIHIPCVVHLMPFGKHKGKPLTSLTPSYRRWILEQENIDDDLRHSVNALQGL